MPPSLGLRRAYSYQTTPRGESEMPSPRKPDSDPQPPRTLPGYTVYRIFNILDRILPDARADWSTTVRAITLLFSFSCPLLTLFGLVALIFTNQTGKAVATGRALALEYGISAAKFSVAVVACGIVVLLAGLGIKRRRTRAEQPRSSEEPPTQQMVEGGGPVNPKRGRSAASKSSAKDVGQVPRQPTG